MVVCNHSGGVLTPDVIVLAPSFYDKLGFDRPLYTLAHYGVFFTPLAGWLRRVGVVHANRENAAKVLHSGGVLLVFPGGDYDSFRPTLTQNVIDFNGRKGYARIAIEAGVPIVPAVSIGAQETQLFLTRGAWLAKRLGLKRIRIGDSAVYDRLPLRPDFDDAGQSAVAVQDHHRGSGADRHRGPVRREPRRRRGGCARPLGDADRTGPVGQRASVSRAGLTSSSRLRVLVAALAPKMSP